MRKARLVMAALVAAGLAPGVAWRSPPPAKNWHAPLRIESLPVAALGSGPVRLDAAWRLASDRANFGGYSALLIDSEGNLEAFSDAGRLLVIEIADGVPVAGRFRPFLRHTDGEAKEDFDIEAVARDPGSGTVWASKEMVNAIQRFDPRLRPDGLVRPQAMADWDFNGGGEAFVRLADGRFVVVQESEQGWFDARHRGLLFAADPVDPATPAPAAFTAAVPKGYSPVDFAQLPDGRVLVLLRALTFPFPPRFASALAIADPATLRPGGEWRMTLLARLDGDWPRENYEGLAIDPAPAPDGSVGLWLISDDNMMDRFQQTLLLRLRLLPGHGGARQPEGATGQAERPF